MAHTPDVRPVGNLPNAIGKTAARELSLSGITTLKQVATFSKKELLAIHGVGPKAITILGEALAAQGLNYKGSEMAVERVPVTYESCAHVKGPFYHGTKASLAIGDVLTTGFSSHFEDGRVLKHVYFSGLLEPAVWGAELAMALSGLGGRGFIYQVEPTGPFEDDPNLTNKRFPGNPTQSFRTFNPLKIVGVVDDWEGHSPEVLQGMLNSLRDLQQRGLYVIED